VRTQKYPSDTSREPFESIKPLPESGRKKTKPRTVDLYEVWCAVLNLLRTGRHMAGDTQVQIAKRSALHTFKVMPKRRIVERGFAWLDKI